MATRAYSLTTKWRLAGLVVMLVLTIAAITVLSRQAPRGGDAPTRLAEIEAAIAELEQQIATGELRGLDLLVEPISKIEEQIEALHFESGSSSSAEEFRARINQLYEELAEREAKVSLALDEANAALDFDPYSADLPLERLSSCLNELDGRDAVLDAAISLVMQAQRAPADEPVEFDAATIQIAAATEWELFQLEHMCSILESRHLIEPLDGAGPDLTVTFTEVADCFDDLRWDQAEAIIEGAEATRRGASRLWSLQRIVQMCRHMQYAGAADAIGSLQSSAVGEEVAPLNRIAAAIHHLRELDAAEQHLIEVAERHTAWQPILASLRELTAPQLVDFARPFDFVRRPEGGPQWRYARYSVHPSEESPDFAPLPQISGEMLVVDLTGETVFNEGNDEGVPSVDPPGLEDDVTIVCILGRDSHHVGSYQSVTGGLGGGGAYRTEADLAFVDWNDRQVLGVAQIYNDPPSSIIVWEGELSSGYHSPITVADVDYWLRSVQERRGGRFEPPIDLPGNPLAGGSVMPEAEMDADDDGDGRISLSEWVAAHGRSRIAEFYALDGDGDGSVIEAEFFPSADAANGGAPENAVTLKSADNRNLIDYVARGNGLLLVLLTVTSNSYEPLLVEVPAGLVFASDNPQAQDMIVTRSALLQFEMEDQEQTIDVQVACAAMNRDTPDEYTTFTIDEHDDDDMEDLLALDAFREQSWRVRQFAVWTITSNPDRYGYVALSLDGVVGLDSGPSDDEIAAIRGLFEQAGIRLRDYPALED